MTIQAISEGPGPDDVEAPEARSTRERILDVALERNFVGKSGSWYTYGESRIGQGRENAKAYLEEHSDVAAELEQKIREALKANVAANGVTHPVGAVAARDDD